ncbi:MAG: preprotein translocase subunit SecA, partial [Deltaproteobacteria bacterium]|nr:preprotein translocase subunit SecA [Deltaproteobacteria bacterium]
LYRELSKVYQEKEEGVGSELLRRVERLIYLQLIDQFWKNHLQAMDHLREGIHFRGYAQKDPKQEYKKEGFLLFNNMRFQLRSAVLERVFKAEIKTASQEHLRTEMAHLEALQRAAKEKQGSQKLVHQQQNQAGGLQASSEGPKLNRAQRRQKRNELQG